MSSGSKSVLLLTSASMLMRICEHEVCAMLPAFHVS